MRKYLHFIDRRAIVYIYKGDADMETIEFEFSQEKYEVEYSEHEVQQVEEEPNVEDTYSEEVII